VCGDTGERERGREKTTSPSSAEDLLLPPSPSPSPPLLVTTTFNTNHLTLHYTSSTMSINECSFTSFARDHSPSQDQIEAMALLERLFGPSSSSSPSSYSASASSKSSSPIDELASWRDAHHHRSSSLSSTTSTDSYWSGPFLSVPETPIDRVEEYPFDLREAPCVGGDVEYRGPRITISPSHSVVEEHNHTVVGGVVVGGEYRSRGGSKKAESKKKAENTMPSITVEFAD